MVTELFRLWSASPFALDVPCATGGTVGIAGMMLGRPFIGEMEDDLAWCGADAEDPAATTGAFEPVATTGVEDGFFAALAAEAYDGAEAAAELFDAGWVWCEADEVISDNLVRLQELDVCSSISLVLRVGS